MAFQFEGKVLAVGQLPNAVGTLYTCPVNTVVWVKYFVVYNNGAGAENVQIYLDIDNAGGTARKTIWKNAALAANTHAQVILDAPLIFHGGTANLPIIEGVTTTAATVDYVICGVLETKQA